MNAVDIGKYLAELRKFYKVTQEELAVRVGVTRQAVSKWERGDVLPDIVTFRMIAECFGVSVDELISGDKPKEMSKRGKRILVTLLSCALVIFLATVGGLFYSSFADFEHLWLFYVYAMPVCSIVWIVFSQLWFSRGIRELAISALVWSAGASIYLSVLVFAHRQLWFLFVVCAVFQILVFIWFALVERLARERENRKNKENSQNE